MSIDYHQPTSKLQLRPEADPSHDSAEAMFDAYGWHLSTESAGDVCVQAVESKWLRDEWTDEQIVAALIEADGDLTRDEAEALCDKARRVWTDLVAIERCLERAVKAYDAGDLDGCVEALQEAGHTETEHGDDPSTSDLANRLLEPKTAFRVYRWPDGSCPDFCGEYPTLEAAEEAAEGEPAGLPKSEWESARRAGHRDGMTAPDPDGDEADEPESWHGANGNYCVVRVTY